MTQTHMDCFSGFSRAESYQCLSLEIGSPNSSNELLIYLAALGLFVGGAQTVSL